jgi:uncharacterized membrane protein
MKMNLDMTVIGWVHSLACALALALGAYMLFTRKGTPRHRLVGRVYVPTMIVVCATSLVIYEARGGWFFPHTLAVVTLGLIAAGWLAARFKQPRGLRIHIHLSAMIGTYYMLIGGGINEVFIRVDALRALFIPPGNGVQIIGMTHAATMLIFLVWIIAANVATAMAGAKRRQGLAPAPA